MTPSNPTATTVVNVKHEECDVYIGRAMPGRPASRFANPFRIGPDGSRAEVLAKYEVHCRALLAQDPAAREDLNRLKGKRLGCWCKPHACHGDFLVSLLDGPAPRQADLF